MSTNVYEPLLQHDLLSRNEIDQYLRDIKSIQTQILEHPDIWKIINSRLLEDDKRDVRGFHHDYFEPLLNQSHPLFIAELYEDAVALNGLYNHLIEKNAKFIYGFCIFDPELFDVALLAFMRAIDMYDFDAEASLHHYASQKIRASLATAKKEYRSSKTISIDSYANDHHRSSFANMLESDEGTPADDFADTAHHHAFVALIKDMAAAISPHELNVLSSYLEIGTLEKTGKALKITKERVRQINEKAKLKIAQHFNNMCIQNTLLSPAFGAWLINKIKSKIDKQILEEHEMIQEFLMYLQNNNFFHDNPTGSKQAKKAVKDINKLLNLLKIPLEKSKKKPGSLSYLKNKTNKQNIINAVLDLYEAEMELEPHRTFDLEWTDLRPI